MRTVAALLLVCAVAHGAQIKPRAALWNKIQRPEGRIIDGIVVQPVDKYPFMASMQLAGSHSCGGTLIGPQSVLTAAHCIESAQFRTVLLGCWDHVTQDEGLCTEYTVERVTQHEIWDANGDGFPNDVGILHLTSAVVENDFTKIGAIDAVGASDHAGAAVTAVGWGYLQGIVGPIPDELRETEGMIVLSNAECSTYWSAVTGAEINDGHICMYHPNGDHGACSGDSGGPMLVTNDDGSYSQCGITSWGLSTCNTAYPSVYTRVSYFRNWIDQNM